MTTVKDLYNYLDGIAPFAYQEHYDNAGILVGDHKAEVSGVLVSLDTTEAVILDAAAKQCNVVIAHHPIIFSGIKKIDYDHYISKAIVTAIKHDIAIIAIHTNLDNVLANGVNERIAKTLNLKDIAILSPKPNPGSQEIIGSGVLGLLPQPMEVNAFLGHLKSTMKAGVVRYTLPHKSMIQSVAICGGSGSFLLSTAIRKEADVFITADFKYHEFFDANNQIIIADIGHYESEQYTIDLLVELISKKFSNFAVHFTEVNTNPINYF